MEISIRVTTKATAQAIVEALEDAGLIERPDHAGAPISIYLGPTLSAEHPVEVTYAIDTEEEEP